MEKDIDINDYKEIEKYISPQKLSRFKYEIKSKNPNISEENLIKTAVNKYIAWAEISGFFLSLFYFTEVLIRNAIAVSLAEVFGEDWPYNPDIKNIINKNHHYCNLQEICEKYNNTKRKTDIIISNLEFKFWEDMLDSIQNRRNMRIYNTLLKHIPNVKENKQNSKFSLRELYSALKDSREFRNKIAHYHVRIDYANSSKTGRDSIEEIVKKQFSNLMDIIYSCSPSTVRYIKKTKKQQFDELMRRYNAVDINQH